MVMGELEKLKYLCSRREYSEFDILEKLRRKGVTESESAEILQALRTGKYIDDSRYASAFIKDKVSLSGWGVSKIVYYLKMKKISSDIIKSSIEEIDQEIMVGRMDEVIERKWVQLKNEKSIENRRNKTIRFAIGRGYVYSDILKSLENIEKSRNRI